MNASQNLTPETNPLATESIGKLIAKFAIPSVIAMLVNALYNITDQIFIGWSVGYLGNAATNVTLLITLAALALALLIGDGTAAWFSLHLGAGDKKGAAHGVGNAVLMLIVVSLSAMLGGLLFLAPLLRLFGATDIILPHATAYGSIIVMGLPLIMSSTALNASIRADGSPRYAMLSMMSGAVLNLALDPLFLFGFGWGIQGAAWATVIGQAVSFGMTVSYLRRFRSVTLEKSAFRFRPATACRICALGISSFIDQMAFTLVMAVNNNLIVHYGALSAYGSEIPLTAYGISMKVQEILFTVLLGIAIGMQPIVGFNYGAGNLGRVRKAFTLAVASATVVSIAATALFVFSPGPLLRLFGAGDNALYMEFGQKFFQTYFLLYPVFGFQIVAGVFFQAIGRPGKAALLSLSYQLAFKILAALILAVHLGLDGVLWSGPAADFLAFFLALSLILVQLSQLPQMKRQG